MSIRMNQLPLDKQMKISLYLKKIKKKLLIALVSKLH